MLTLKWSYGVFRHPRGRKIAIIPKLLQIKIWNFLTFIIWLSSKNWCHYYFVGCHLWRHHGHQRGTGRRRNYNFLTVHSIKQDIHFFYFCENVCSQPYLCFWGRGIQWWHFQNYTTTGLPRKSSSNRKFWNFKVTHLSPLWNFMTLPIFMFSRSRNSMVTLSKLYHH